MKKMQGSAMLLAVVGGCGLVLGDHAAHDTPHASRVLSATDSFFFQTDPIPGNDVTRSSFGSVFSPNEQAAAVVDRDWIWQRYYSHLMSPTRSTPFIVYFTDDGDACAGLEGEADDHEDSDGPTEDEIASCKQQRDHMAAVTAHLEAVVHAKGFPSASVLPVVHIRKAQLSQAFVQHRVPSTPSLMWFPPRSTGNLQRFAHAQTNFLAFPSPVDATWVGHNVASFLRRCFRESGLQFPTSNAAPPPAQPVVAHEDSLFETVLNTLPFLAIILYALLMVVEHRATVLGVLRRRVTWLLLSEFVVYVSLSGLFHSIIHRVPLFYAHPYYGVYLIHPSGRKQFFLEGLVNGTWSFVVSFGSLSIAHVMPTAKSKTVRDEIFQWALLAVGVAYAALHLVFAAKHPWLSR